MNNWKNTWNEFKKGNQQALSDIFLEHYDALFRYVFRFVIDTDTAKDILQDMFLRLWKNREQLGEPECLIGYLYKAARNQCLNHLKNKTILTSENPVKDTAIVFEPEDFFPDENPENPYKIKLMATLNELPAKQREAIYLKYFEGFSIDEIAEIMQQQNQSVRNNLHRALSKLREKMVLTMFLSMV